MARNTNQNNTIVDNKYNLTQRQLDFAIYYVETGNITEAALKAGYSKHTAMNQGYRLFKNEGVKQKIYDLRHDENKLKIATGKEVMDFFTRVMNGEVKDQFGLEASLSDRLKAANELAKRTTDVELRETEKSNEPLRIKIDWGNEEESEETKT